MHHKIAVELINVGRKYEGRWIFRGKNGLFSTGIHNITGPNGCGKSTLLQIIAGVTPTSEGEVKVTSLGTPLLRYEKKIAMVAPYIVPIEGLYVGEIAAHSLNAGFRNAEVDEMLKKIALYPYSSRKYSALSTGMQRRLSLACALYSNRPLLLLDEPFSHLDAEWSGWLDNFLAKESLFSKGRLCIIASQHPIGGEKKTYNFLH